MKRLFIFYFLVAKILILHLVCNVWVDIYSLVIRYLVSDSSYGH
jgi:hypothetical protein